MILNEISETAKLYGITMKDLADLIYKSLNL